MGLSANRCQDLLPRHGSGRFLPALEVRHEPVPLLGFEHVEESQPLTVDRILVQA